MTQDEQLREPLSPRQKQVLIRLGEGMTTKQIAAELKLTTRTIEDYKGQLMNKLDIHTTIGLAAHAQLRARSEAVTQTMEG